MGAPGDDERIINIQFNQWAARKRQAVSNKKMVLINLYGR